MKIINLEKIKEIIDKIDLIPLIEEGFVKYSIGQAVVPPVGELLFDKPPGDVHIKYGYIMGDDYYVIKIASGFHENPKLGIPSGNGMMILFNQKTGEPVGGLFDRGYLMDVRTGVAGAIAAKYLAPRKIRKIGIVGTGTQARLQLVHLKSVISCRETIVFGRNDTKLDQYKNEMVKHGFVVSTTKDINELTSQCNLIVTTTTSRQPLISCKQVQKGTHITAVGSDTPSKQELDQVILGEADLVVADSISQCLERGEIFHAFKEGILQQDDIVELGQIIEGKIEGRTSEDQITIADLTGVAVQDIQISKAVYEGTNEN